MGNGMFLSKDDTVSDTWSGRMSTDTAASASEGNVSKADAPRDRSQTASITSEVTNTEEAQEKAPEKPSVNPAKEGDARVTRIQAKQQINNGIPANQLERIREMDHPQSESEAPPSGSYPPDNQSDEAKRGRLERERVLRERILAVRNELQELQTDIRDNINASDASADVDAKHKSVTSGGVLPDVTQTSTIPKGDSVSAKTNAPSEDTYKSIAMIPSNTSTQSGHDTNVDMSVIHGDRQQSPAGNDRLDSTATGDVLSKHTDETNTRSSTEADQTAGAGMKTEQATADDISPGIETGSTVKDAPEQGGHKGHPHKLKKQVSILCECSLEKHNAL